MWARLLVGDKDGPLKPDISPLWLEVNDDKSPTMMSKAEHPGRVSGFRYQYIRV
jgi:hypothetical protein